MKKLRLAQTMMIATIILIVGFQAFYITRLYSNEWKDLKKETDVLFRETVYKLQVARFKKDTTLFTRRLHTDSVKLNTDNVFNFQAMNVIRNKKKKAPDKIKDSASNPKAMIITMPADGLNHTEISEKLRARVESLTLARPGTFKIITSTSEAGNQVRMFSRTIRDTLFRKDSVLKKVLKEGYTNDLNIAPVSRVHVPGKARITVRDTSRKAFRENILKDRTIAIRSSSFSDDPEIQIFANSSSANDSLSLPQLDSAFKNELKKASIKIPFKLVKNTGKRSALLPKEKELKTNPSSVGIFSPYHYQAAFENPFNFLLQKIAPNILLSLLLVAFTIVSFVVLYRNLMSQRRLADIKNDFISNITHELKTPIATVNVAIEAMKNFNVLNDTKRTQEYLDISASELQRLSLLVDKVLKLSMFEKKEIELKKEWFNMEELVKEVMNSMRLQFEKQKASVSIDTEGDKLDIKADRLHIMSVVYNLLDNALKYSNQGCNIDINMFSRTQYLELQVTDNGIGISEEFKSKIFEQFFRVPSGDRHNIKGYGLGLSYVNHIVKIHQGLIEVESEFGKGSTFTVKLPYEEATVVHFDKNRSIKKDFFNRN
ncbi:MAG TPA: HAMP domain-containing sensor histidine kinase [Segetibacter sp.]|jgi:two-component system phosphate regulon sensor histidine kinase PhoR